MPTYFLIGMGNGREKVSPGWFMEELERRE